MLKTPNREELWADEQDVITHSSSKPKWPLPLSKATRPTLAELTKPTQHFDVHPNQITDWKNPLLLRAGDLFGGNKHTEPQVEIKTLHAKIGELPLENDFLEGREVSKEIAEKLIDILAPERNATTSEQNVFKGFQKSFNFNADKKDKRLFSVAFDWPNQEQIAGLLNRYVEMVALQTKQDIIGKVKGDLLQNKITVEQAIASKRAMAAQRRSDEIARLSEALLIAQALNITTAESSSLLRNVDFSQSQGSNPIALFSQGSNTLQAQISALKSRKTDDPYISGIRGLQEQLVTLNNKLLAINDDFKVVRIDQQAYRPDSPIKPKKRLIVALGGVLGLMLGIFAAFFFNFVENNRKEEGAEA